MTRLVKLFRPYLTALAALGLVLACYARAKFPSLASAEAARLAERFHFSKQPLPEVADHPQYKFVRQVHPSLSRISAWVSSLGAAVTLADLDGDGLANDLCHVDPRTDWVTVAPVPGTGERYRPFVLNPAPLPYDAATMAPMGTVAGDFNEDGLMDVLVYYWGRTPVLLLRKNQERPTAQTGSHQALSRDDFVAAELVPTGER